MPAKTLTGSSLVILVALIVCNIELKNQPVIPSNGEPTDNGIVRFKVNDSLVKTSAWNVSDINGMTGVYTINITSNMHRDKRTIGFNINGNKGEGIVPGHYPFAYGGKTVITPGIAYGSYWREYMKGPLNNYRLVSGEVIVTSIDLKNSIINVSFSGKAKNSRGEEITITEGKLINGKIKHPDKHLIN